MKKIFLTSYFAGTLKQFQSFVKDNAITDKEVVYIPTAGNVEEYTGYIDEGKEALKELNFVIDELDITQYSEKFIAKKIKNAKLLFVSGGNTFYLLQELKRKNLLPLVSKQINQGLPYIGESAGAIILAPNIEYNKIMDSIKLAPELVDYRSLGITNFYTLPHYIEFPFIETVQKTLTAYQFKLNLVPISNSEAIIMNDIGYEILK